jgi:hypothetical protein
MISVTILCAHTEVDQFLNYLPDCCEVLSEHSEKFTVGHWWLWYCVNLDCICVTFRLTCNCLEASMNIPTSSGYLTVCTHVSLSSDTTFCASSTCSWGPHFILMGGTAAGKWLLKRWKIDQRFAMWLWYLWFVGLVASARSILQNFDLGMDAVNVMN